MTITTDETPLTFTRNAGNSQGDKAVTVKVKPVSGAPDVDVQLIDSSFRVEMNDMFLEISDDSANYIYTDNIAVYDRDAGQGSGSTVSEAIFDLRLKPITDTTFTLFSTSGGQSIKTFVKVTGVNSGLSKVFEVKINKAS
jgi:hypothetical protein